MKYIIFYCLSSIILLATPQDTQDLIVKITKEIPFVNTIEDAQNIKIIRIQDPAYRLTDDYTKTSRLCPPFCIQPNKIDKEIENIGELELLHFMEHDVKEDRGLVIDARLENWYQVESIPSAVNVPFNVIEKANKRFVEKIFQVFGMNIKNDGSWDFSKVKKLAIFCNGVWCEQSKHLITGLLKYGYPKNRILYYRSGFQGWKLLGFTTVMHKGKMQ